MLTAKAKVSTALAVASAALILGVSACSSGSAASSGSSGASAGSANLNDMTVAQLYAKAKSEGQVNWYTSLSETDIPKVQAAFEKAYPGITVNGLYLSGQTPVTRIETEAKGGLHNADVVSGGGDAVLLQQAGLIDQSYASAPDAPPLPAGLSLPKGIYVDRILTNVISYNPTALKRAGLKPPTSFADFTEPEWKGKFSMDPTTSDIVDSLGPSEGYNTVLQLMKRIGANDPVFVTSHSLSSSQVASGTVIAAMSTYGYTALTYQKKDPSTTQVVNPDPLPVGISEIAVVKAAPHPAAARLFTDWTISQAGQEFFVAKLNQTSIRSDVTNPPGLWNPSEWKPEYENPDLSTAETNTLLAEYQAAIGYKGQ